MSDDSKGLVRRLRPRETVQKVLISTTSKMTGEYENDGILITHAWPQFGNRSTGMRLSETHMSRSSYVIAFETESFAKDLGSVLPNYSPAGRILAAYLSVLFGKRFDSHGLLEGSGFYHVPDMGPYDTPSSPTAPFNSHEERGPPSVALELNQVSTIERAFLGPHSETTDQSRLEAACRFYMQALQNAEHNVEVAYLHLITAGEILSSCFRRLDVKGVRDKVVKALHSLLSDDFFSIRGSAPTYARFDSSNIEGSISAAYDLRSYYVHTGTSFGKWVDLSMGGVSGDVQMGRPVVEDERLGEALAAAPTFLGLERLVRYCILTLMASRGLFAGSST